MSKSLYNQDFYEYTDRVSHISAATIIPIVQSLCGPIASVADFGCARGTWLKTWGELGVEDFLGIDGYAGESEEMYIPANQFRAQNLNEPIDLERRFDLAQSLEVAEHLNPATAQNFVASLTRHADMVLFSAAPPGQGGEHHINEQSYEFWRGLFAAHGFNAYDCIRPRIAGREDVAFWYRYNVVLYVKAGAEQALSDEARASRVPDGQSIADVSPLAFKMRKAVVRCLPGPVQNVLAQIKARAG